MSSPGIEAPAGVCIAGTCQASLPGKWYALDDPLGACVSARLRLRAKNDTFKPADQLPLPLDVMPAVTSEKGVSWELTCERASGSSGIVESVMAYLPADEAVEMLHK